MSSSTPIVPALSSDVPDEARGLDMDLYIRQFYVFGEAMQKLKDAKVFLSGLGGVGVEIAKNITLAGIHRLTLHDTKNASNLDLCTNFYLSSDDVGNNRAEVCCAKIQELNQYVRVDHTNVSLETVDLDELLKGNYDLVILTDASLEDQLRIDRYCHGNDVKFICADVRGVFAWSFTDFGQSHHVYDKNGEELGEVLIDGITNACPPVVSVLDGGRHDMEDGSLVSFRDVRGMEPLNGGDVFVVRGLTSSTFSLYRLAGPSDGDEAGGGKEVPVDASEWPAYEGGGTATNKKRGRTLCFSPLAESLDDPSFEYTDYSKLDVLSAHIGMRALHGFSKGSEGGSLPRPWSSEDSDGVVHIARGLVDSIKGAPELDDDLVRLMAHTARGSLVGLTSFLGGLVAQEAVKGVTGKYTPVHQWCYIDAREVVPPAGDGARADHAPLGDRYDAQRICIGEETCEVLRDMTLFMIGSGAIGCEMLKNYALLGCGAGPDGMVTITDNDVIEKSNLNRQFLFRNSDISQPKSKVAARAAVAMNPSLHVDARLDLICPDTEGTYSDGFFRGQDVVVNALDNIQARLYVDQRCVTNGRPLLESGTLSCKGHVQVILPHKTESYGSRRDPPEKDVPFCTLKSFPNKIEHTIQWARDKFEHLFVIRPEELKQLMEDPSYLDQQVIDGGGDRMALAEKIVRILKGRPHTFEDCVRWALRKFQQNFHNKIVQLLHCFPLDHRTKEGEPFWSGAKLPPRAAAFDASDALHLDFVRYAACLWAKVWRIEPVHTDPKCEEDLDFLRRVCAAVDLPKFVPDDSKRIETDETKTKEDALGGADDEPPEFDEARYRSLIAEIRGMIGRKSEFGVSPEDFEKDDDTNFHIDFITAASNCRAANYGIVGADRLKTRRIAGRIVPAIATTTAAVAGLVATELVKIAQRQDDLDAYKNTFLNLGIGFCSQATPFPPEQTEIVPGTSITLWDSWEVKDATLTVQGFLDHFEAKWGLTVSGIFKGVQMVYVPFMPGHNKRLPVALRKLLPDVEEGQKYVDLIVTFDGPDGEDVHGPPVRFWLVGGKKKRRGKRPSKKARKS